MIPLPTASSQTSSTAEGVNSTLYRKATAPRTPHLLGGDKQAAARKQYSGQFR